MNTANAIRAQIDRRIGEIRRAFRARSLALQLTESAAIEDEYARRLVVDLFAIDGETISTKNAIEKLSAMPNAPWSQFRGEGLTARNLADLLSRFGVRPVRIAEGHGRGKQRFMRGYRRADLERAMTRL